MSQLEQITFNLLVNSSLSFFIGIMIVVCSIKLIRLGNCRWRLFLLSLPFVKIVFDILKGVPNSSVVFTGLDPFNLPPKSQLLEIGAGWNDWGPVFSVVLSANDLAGVKHSSSLADYLSIWLIRNFGPNIPRGLLLVVLLCSLALVIRRFVSIWNFEIKRKHQRLLDQTHSTIKVGFRTVDIYVSKAFKGTPFTGGVLNPYICFPAVVFNLLSEDERTAAINHEIAHIKNWDLVFSLAIKIMGDLFWFVPGYNLLATKIDRLREILADERAIDFGAKSQYLASALIKLGELPATNDSSVLYSAFFREKSLLKVRVDRLLKKSDDSKPRFLWKFKVVRIALAIFVTSAVMSSTFGGNHRPEDHVRPKWFEDWLAK